MSKVTIHATFNKQTKDSKKEMVQFHVKGNDETLPELNHMCREAVELEIEGVEQKLSAKFEKKTQDSTKTSLDFILMGNPSTSNSHEFYRKAGADVKLTIVESQMSIEELEEIQKNEREGIEYTQNEDGTVDVMEDENQAALETSEEEDPELLETE